MAHPAGTSTPSSFVFVNLKGTKEQEPSKKIFGYIINILLATFWLLLFVYTSRTLLFNTICDIKDYSKLSFIELIKLIDKAPRTILVLASLILGGFHAYILHFYDQERNKDDTLSKRILRNWPLVLGTLLYVITVCWVYSGRRMTTDGNGPFHFDYQNILLFSLVLIFPLTICSYFLYYESSSNIFSPWTVKTDEIKDEHGHKLNLSGVFLYNVLIFFWLMIVAMTFCISWFDREKEICLLGPVYLLINICDLVICSVLLYGLCTPEYDSGDSPTWGGFARKNWLIISCCLIIFSTCVLMIIKGGRAEADIKDHFLGLAMLTTLLSLFTFLLLVSSKDVPFVKPWIIVNRNVNDRSKL